VHLHDLSSTVPHPFAFPYVSVCTTVEAPGFRLCDLFRQVLNTVRGHGALRIHWGRYSGREFGSVALCVKETMESVKMGFKIYIWDVNFARMQQGHMQARKASPRDAILLTS
jgi:hypothetical protein